MSYVHICVSFSLCHGLVTVISSNIPLSSGWTKATWGSGGFGLGCRPAPLLIMSHIGQEMPGLWGYQALLCGTEMSACYNPSPWINIQQGLSHFARLFVATLRGLHWYRWMKMPSNSQGEQQTYNWKTFCWLLRSSIIHVYVFFYAILFSFKTHMHVGTSTLLNKVTHTHT